MSLSGMKPRVFSRAAAVYAAPRRPDLDLVETMATGASSFKGIATAAVGVVALIVSIPMLKMRGTDVLAAEILDGHLRALQPMHQVDVPSTDQHTVKPWFQGKTSFSPPVPDLSKQDFVLIGGRLGVIQQQPAAAIVYRRRQHIISLYVLPSSGANSKSELSELGGYHLIHWRQNDMSYWGVSDVDPNDLRRFAEFVRGS